MGVVRVAERPLLSVVEFIFDIPFCAMIITIVLPPANCGSSRVEHVA